MTTKKKITTIVIIFLLIAGIFTATSVIFLGNRKNSHDMKGNLQTGSQNVPNEEDFSEAFSGRTQLAEELTDKEEISQEIETLIGEIISE